ncbi:MAG: hypothetical protein HYT40_03580 [Candidatus Sungbacteria bacterium]|uniref:Heat-inducible transcription repressor HrcA C-terminal domain-containing protein n=1 Tax=Candidatus Sungiibacteriota bacterium TaxID=2750080 RepID=A0A931WPX0_9BACT|nr:hypothetical protein [Candidatus Sungbacteria bacterium]
MRFSERQREILFAAIGEHIRTGEPVASGDLKQRYHIRFSPATVRNELMLLSEEGYLSQPHTSAGRIPTDAGYRWYVDAINGQRWDPNQRVSLNKGAEKKLREDLRFSTDFDDLFRRSTETFAEMVHALVIGGLLDEHDPLHKSGFSQVFSDPEFSKEGMRNNFGELMDSIDSDMRALAKAEGGSYLRVFIGKENPIPEARSYSMILKKIVGQKGDGVLAILGPKRMHYDTGLALLRTIEDMWQQ